MPTTIPVRVQINKQGVFFNRTDDSTVSAVRIEKKPAKLKGAVTLQAFRVDQGRFAKPVAQYTVGAPGHAIDMQECAQLAFYNMSTLNRKVCEAIEAGAEEE